MSLPTLVRTWQTSCNNAQAALGSALADNRGLLIAIKNQMLTFGTNPWTVRYSCNSTTAGTAGDGVDRWASTPANLVWQGAGSAHSWIVLQQSGIATGFQLLLSCEGSSASGSIMVIVVSPSAGFTGGTTTARPTATDEQVLVNGVGWGGVGTVDQSARWSVEQSTDGAGTRIVTCAGGAVTGIAFFEQPANVVTGWSSPSVSLWVNGTGTLANFSTYGNSKGRIGATSANLGISCEGTAGTAALGPADAVFGNIANEVSGEWPFWPLGIDCSTAGVRGRHGTLVDLWFGSSNVPSGDSYPATGTTGQFAQFGVLIIPWNNGAVNLS